MVLDWDPQFGPALENHINPTQRDGVIHNVCLGLTCIFSCEEAALEGQKEVCLCV